MDSSQLKVAYAAVKILGFTKVELIIVSFFFFLEAMMYLVFYQLDMKSVCV